MSRNFLLGWNGMRKKGVVAFKDHQKWNEVVCTLLFSSQIFQVEYDGLILMWWGLQKNDTFYHLQYKSLGIQSPCQMMIGVYNHLRNARYLGSVTILRRWLDPYGIGAICSPSLGPFHLARLFTGVQGLNWTGVLSFGSCQHWDVVSSCWCSFTIYTLED